MKFLGLAFIFLGALLFIGGITTGEVCIGKSKLECFQYATNPRKFFQFILVYPSFAIGMGWQIYSDHTRIDLKIILYSMSAMLIGYLFSLLF